MTDLEATRLCAEAMGLAVYVDAYGDLCLPDIDHDGDNYQYYPLHDDAQAMALVKAKHLQIGKTLRNPDEPHGRWFVSATDKYEVDDADLNRAIVYCVAKMQANRCAPASNGAKD